MVTRDRNVCACRVKDQTTEMAMESEQERINGTRITVFATEESTSALVKMLKVFPATEICTLAWPPSTPMAGVAEAHAAPDLVVCEIGDTCQAEDWRSALGRLWPDSLIVSCEKSRGSFERQPESLIAASRDAGYHGHLLIDEAALHLPFFLRYAAQRRQTEAKLERLEQVLKSFSQILISLDLQRVATGIIEEFSRWIAADGWLLYTVSEDSHVLELVTAEGVRVRPHSLKLTLDGSVPGNTALHRGKMAANNRTDAGSSAHGAAVEAVTTTEEQTQPQSSMLCLPLVVEGAAVGLIQAIRHDGNFEKPDELFLAELSRIASLALNNAMRYERAERMYMQDDLTRLYNSRYLRLFVDREIKRARRYHSHFSVLFIDLDGFKQVNDQFGHRVGSETLCETAELLTEVVRETDVVARYGGDEFTIVLPETSADNAMATAERIRQRIAEKIFSGGSEHQFRLTVSIGVAAFPDHAENAADLLEQADLAMYEAKAVGKNNVKVSR